MDSKTITDKTVDVISQFTHSSRSVKLNDDLVYDLGLDSIDLIEMIIDIENTMRIPISDNDTVDKRTVFDIVELVKSKYVKEELTSKHEGEING